MSWTLIVMTIFCSLALFPVVTPHRVNTAVHLQIRDQFFFLTRPLTVFVLLSRHLFWLFFFQTPECHHHTFPFSAVFFYCRFLANVVIFTWVSWCLSIHRNFSDSTGTIQPLFIFAYYVPFTIYPPYEPEGPPIPQQGWQRVAVSTQWNDVNRAPSCSITQRQKVLRYWMQQTLKCATRLRFVPLTPVFFLQTRKAVAKRGRRRVHGRKQTISLHMGTRSTRKSLMEWTTESSP